MESSRSLSKQKLEKELTSKEKDLEKTPHPHGEAGRQGCEKIRTCREIVKLAKDQLSLTEEPDASDLSEEDN